MKHQLRANLEFAVVDGHKMHVFKAGSSGKPKLVFMPGSGTVAPMYDFKVLYEKLLDDFQVIIVEKFGYGYSDLHETRCDIDALVAFQRQALAQAGETGPFILVPHSMAGLEAIRWRQTHPQEVQAIIGLDMATPTTYGGWDQREIDKRVAYMRKIRKLNERGLLFWYPLNNRGLDADETRQQRLLLRRNAMNSCYVNEAKAVLENAAAIEAGETIDCPILMFVSDGTQTSPHWIQNVREFAEETNAQMVCLDCGHRVYCYESERISRAIREFVATM